MRASVVIAAGAGSACASAPPDAALPAPRGSSASGLDVDPATPVEVGLLGTVRGGIRFLADPAGGPDLGMTVVLLQRRPSRPGARPAAPRAASDTVRLASRSPRFEPPFRAVQAGQPVLFVNAGPLEHRVFSLAVREGAAIRLPPESRSAAVTLPPTGPVRFYCSLHPDETFVVFAARADHLALPDSGGAFRFPAVPSGRYTLSIWSEVVRGPVKEIEVSGTGATETVVWIDPRLIRP